MISVTRTIARYSTAATGPAAVVSPAVEKGVERDAWIEGHSHYSVEPTSPGPYYPTTHKLHFPMNAYFKPNPPLSNLTKNRVFEMYQSGTPIEKVADLFGVSVMRVNAICRLKSLEEKFKQRNVPIQSKLAGKMDFFLGSVDLKPAEGKTPEERYELLKPHLSERLKPYFTILEENKHMSPEEAANLLKTDPFSPVAPVDKHAKKEEIKKYGKDEKNTSNYMFIFHMGEKCIVREQNGALRDAKREEIHSTKL